MEGWSAWLDRQRRSGKDAPASPRQARTPSVVHHSHTPSLHHSSFVSFEQGQQFDIGGGLVQRPDGLKIFEDIRIRKGGHLRNSQYALGHFEPLDLKMAMRHHTAYQ